MIEREIELEDCTPTSIWQEYERGVSYNRRKNLYTNTDRNYNFFHGKQWENAKLGDMSPIVINVIKPIVKYKVGVINQNAYSVVFSPSYLESNAKEANKLCELLSKHTDRFFENQNITSKLRTIVKDACINSEGIFFMYFDENEGRDGEVIGEVVDKNNIYYGDETNENIEEQPYIIIAFRKPVSVVREEAIKKGVSREDIELIVSDEEKKERAGYTNNTNNEELTPMCLELLKLYKKVNADGVKTVHFTKCTKFVEIEKEQDTKMKLYPVAHFVWEEEKGNARGMGDVEPNIPNQIEINKTEMRRAIIVKDSAYPKLAYNKSYIKNLKSLNQVGAKIELEGAGIDDIRKYVGYINGTSMSADSKYLLEELIQHTQNLAGAGDNASGNIDVTKTSARAILAVQQAQEQPLNEQLYRFKEFLESIARIYLDMIQNYMINGLVISDDVEQQAVDEMGNITTETVTVGIPVSYETLNELKTNVKVDITPTTPFSKMDMEQSLENLFTADKITFEEWVNALPYDSSYPKKRLEEIIKQREQTKKDISMMQQNAQNQMNEIQQLLGQRSRQEDINNISNQGNAQIMQFQQALQNVGGNR